MVAHTTLAIFSYLLLYDASSHTPAANDDPIPHHRPRLSKQKTSGSQAAPKSPVN
ncbi:hypothetical protein P3342_003722 [Pyrenophora teres f. teres]|nr:hypothetical protein P3342_003722 [Pyrenophora teres f. teres]